VPLHEKKRNGFPMPLGIDKKAVVGTLALAGMLKIGLSIQSLSEPECKILASASASSSLARSPEN
jgi:hypothetical protein